jgi:hypothetical protein
MSIPKKRGFYFSVIHGYTLRFIQKQRTIKLSRRTEIAKNIDQNYKFKFTKTIEKTPT